MKNGPVDVNAVIVKMVPLLRRRLGESYDLETELDTSLRTVDAAPKQVERLVHELITSARVVPPVQSRWVIKTRNEAFEHPVEPTQQRRHDHVVVSMVSTPAAPTTPDGDRNGPVTDALPALSGLHELARTCGGYVTASREGLVARMEIYLGGLARPAARGGTTTEPEEVSPGANNETILLADDEDPVREFVRIVLERNGYRVLVARNGAEALRVSGTFDGPIHLMLADVVMPELGGPEAAERLHRLRPDMKVLFLSGYSNQVVARDHDGAFGKAYLQKPFTMDALSRKVREVLDT